MRDALRGTVELARLGNCVAAGGLTATGAFVAGAGGAALPTALAAATTVFAVAAGNAINDYFDREIDAVNSPGRPIPRGAVSPRTALATAALWFAVAVAFAVRLPTLAIGIAAVNLVALVTYTSVFKGTPGLGNALVAYLVGSTFLFGGAAVGNPHAVLVLAALAGLSTFTREVIKDVEDVAGDREEGLATLPIAVGERRALWIGAAALGVAVTVSPLPYLSGTLGAAYLAVVAVADAVMLYAAYEGFADPAAAQRRFKYGTFLAAVAFVVGRAAVVA
ncbi:geranylgeranylglycerol-phosphate geranylgeranyltransferase [Halorubrum ezzemoulense]|uniref:geranylgeranylglycerol-phosphate geranylgeranyltransferase n=1 Tax=Halorubrum ezzemoulense TaxID=337243 RepID=UPI00232CBE22|nr:geranylgeranylglycerol-phosphate geranylgeranyltransferase [Halorubrum ezzemoulense]MDB2261906.1 geranylgeranylglycerol-phosphate geranylgeranyltransferase [Halorubrum ezzemoulense]MDB2268789.1 geranylgeranylglycerol-phosphate geranylgeranyltransferase [Halorubrum ezzemoulense]